LGAISTDEGLAMPSRHLGLVQAGETDELEARIDVIAQRVAAQCDLDAIHAAAGATADFPTLKPGIRPPGQRIAIARDAAFSFFYPHMARWWRSAGAELHFFSPLADEAPPADCDACWLPGGYPELHAGRIAANHRFMNGLSTFAQNRPVHGECGGYMVLGRTLEDGDGAVHAMAGLLPMDSSFAKRRRTLGYRRALLRQDSSFAAAGQPLLGHEFHYASITASEGEALADMADAEGQPLAPAGHRVGHVTGGFFHLIA
jgi:cobyrinic acid a,c-diamide synthase